MSNFICSECGMTNIDCGRAGYKTPKEIELEHQIADLSKKVKKLKEQLEEANEMLKGAKHLTVKDSNGAIMFELVSPEINDYLKKWGVK